MNEMTQVMPEVKTGVVPYLQVDGALKAADFYVRALGAEIVNTMPPDANGRTMHVHIHLNGNSIMFGDPMPEAGCAAAETPQAFNLMLITKDVDAAFRRAIDAGATEIMPPADMFWGDRYAMVRDPFGVRWAFNQPGGRG
jgi:PhnB protein